MARILPGNEPLRAPNQSASSITETYTLRPKRGTVSRGRTIPFRCEPFGDKEDLLEETGLLRQGCHRDLGPGLLGVRSSGGDGGVGARVTVPAALAFVQVGITLGERTSARAPTVLRLLRLARPEVPEELELLDDLAGALLRGLLLGL